MLKLGLSPAKIPDDNEEKTPHQQHNANRRVIVCSVPELITKGIFLFFWWRRATHLHVHSRSLISLKSGSTHVAEFVTSQLACDAHTRLRVFDFYRIPALKFDKQRALLLLQFVDRVLVELRDTSCVRCLVTIHRPPMLHDAGIVPLQLFILAPPVFGPHGKRLAGRKRDTVNIWTILFFFLEK